MVKSQQDKNLELIKKIKDKQHKKNKILVNLFSFSQSKSETENIIIVFLQGTDPGISRICLKKKKKKRDDSFEFVKSTGVHTVSYVMVFLSELVFLFVGCDNQWTVFHMQI